MAGCWLTKLNSGLNAISLAKRSGRAEAFRSVGEKTGIEHDAAKRLAFEYLNLDIPDHRRGGSRWRASMKSMVADSSIQRAGPANAAGAPRRA
jgi:hypothetical protein